METKCEYEIKTTPIGRYLFKLFGTISRKAGRLAFLILVIFAKIYQLQMLINNYNNI